MHVFILGRAERAERIDLLRRDTLEFRSRRGLRHVDRILVEALPKVAPTRALTGLDSEGSVALALNAIHPQTRATWFHLDAYVADRVAGNLRTHGADPAIAVVAPDLPGHQPAGDVTPEFDLIALPFPAGGEALFARELVEEAHDLLLEGGKLIAATDRSPEWTARVAREVFGKIDIVKAEGGGAVIHCVRRSMKRAWKDHSHVVHLEQGERTLAFRTRPGVFSYGHVDRGTKALLDVARIPNRSRILDIGCGYGVLGIATAVACGGSTVLVDSNARAVQLAGENAATSGVADARAILVADAPRFDETGFDAVLANPPYFADYRIAESFIEGAWRALKAGGSLWLVAKAIDEHMTRVEDRFGVAHVEECDGYGVIHATRA